MGIVCVWGCPEISAENGDAHSTVTAPLLLGKLVFSTALDTLGCLLAVGSPLRPHLRILQLHGQQRGSLRKAGDFALGRKMPCPRQHACSQPYPIRRHAHVDRRSVSPLLLSISFLSAHCLKRLLHQTCHDCFAPAPHIRRLSHLVIMPEQPTVSMTPAAESIPCEIELAPEPAVRRCVSMGPDSPWNPRPKKKSF